MKTVRFSQVVKKAGKPSTHLQLVPAGKDPALKKAAKLQRVMTVNQDTVGHAADHGIVGLEPDLKGQILIFPRSLAKFSGRKIIGIKYDMLEEPDLPAQALAPITKRKRKAKKTSKKLSPASHKKEEEKREPSAVETVEVSGKSTSHATKKRRGQRSPSRAKSTKPAPRRQKKKTASETLAGIKRAIQALEDGQSVKAYNVLKELV